MNTKWIGLVVAAVVMVAAGVLWHSAEPPASEPPVIGVISLTPVDSRTQAGFKSAMAELGYVEGRDVVYRVSPPAGHIDRLDAIIGEQLAAGVDLIFVSSTPGTLAVKRATAGSNLPVVFAPVNDPVGSGIVPSLKRPSGNITGIRLPRGDNLRLQWLAQLSPQVKRVFLPYNAADKSALESLRQVEQGAETLGLDLIAHPITNIEEVDAAAANIPAEADAVFLPRDSTVESRVERFVEATLARRLPLCAPSLLQVEAGALLSYGFNHFQIGRQAARLVQQILAGTPPADLPVETAESYLALNLKSAEAIGMELPEAVLRQAAELVR